MPIPYPDPDIVNISGNVDPPEVGNILTVPLQYLDKSPVTVEWSQTFRANRDEYYQLVYTNTSKGKYCVSPCSACRTASDPVVAASSQHKVLSLCIFRQARGL